MKKILLLLFLLGFSGMQAQNNTGFHSDNYSGVYSLNFNPAEIVNNRYRLHVNLFSLDMAASNNYLGLKTTALFSKSDTAFNDPDFNDNYVVERLNGRRKSVYQSLNLGLAPSFILTFGKKTQHAIGLNLRVRETINANGIDERTARQAWHEQLITELYNEGIQNKNFSLQAAGWVELGVSYGRDIINTGTHYLKAAASMKLTQGLASAYFYSDNADIVFTSDSTLTVADTDFKFGYSEAFSSMPTKFKEVFEKNRYGLGWDFGAVYEYRPKHADYKYEMNGDPDFVNPTKNQYLFKVGLGVMDLGFLNFERSRGFDAEFYANVNDIVLERAFSEAFNDFGTTGLQGFNDTLTILFDESRTKREYYQMAMPTRINLYFDYHIWKGFYANFTATIAPGYVRNPEKTRALSEFSITPRFENSWFGFFMPVSINTHGNFHFGTGLRIGPLVVGTNDITPLLGRKTVYDANFYLALNVPIARGLKDKDKDHVSRKFDQCKKVAGTWATKGCPDKDGDEITDSEDKCPDNAGLAEFNGCPDKDGDKIIDSEDKCPDDAGLAEFGGCPDRDGDKIIDSEDNCPDEAGLAAFNGCPDTDGDGIMDKEDDCPKDAGSAEFNGCPDTDGDGIMDKDDDCPKDAGLAAFKGCPDTDGDGTMDKEDGCIEVSGPKENKGCPWPDTDGDGILDKDDKCPKVAGTVANKGCPEIKEDVKEVIKLAFEKLEFETARATIKSQSLPSLDKLAKVMKDNPEYRLKIAGHTDNVGDPKANMQLSKDRAESVKNFFVKKGIDEKRFVVEAYGDTKPIADNSRSSGRKQNRRVEMEISFEQ